MNLDSGPGKAPSNRTSLVRWHYWLYWAGVACAFVAALTAFGLIKWPSRRAQQRGIGSAITDSNPGQATISTGVEFQRRRLYPYSVVPGGVESAAELRNAISRDPLVAQLYASFDLSRAHIVRLTHDREVYVSYRYDGKIYWTKKRLLLRAGETVITEGKETGRTRCGNRVSETPMQPVRQNEPPNAAVNTPVNAPTYAGAEAPATELAENTDTLPLLPVGSPSLDPDGRMPLIPQTPPSPTVIPPPFFPLVGGGPPSFPNVTPPPPVAAPEPGELLLLAIGLIALGLMALFTVRQTRKA